MNHPLASLIAAIVVLIAIGCSESSASPPETVVPTTATQFTSTVTANSLLNLENIIAAGFTHIRSDGNRYATGKGDLPNTVPDVIPTGAQLAWVVGLQYLDEVYWVIVESDGSVRGIVSHPGSTLEPVRIKRQGDGAGPPVLYADGRDLLLIQSPADAWQHSPPIYIGQPAVEISTNLGNLVLEANGSSKNLGIPSDARLLTDEEGRLLVLTGATDRYPHGVVGDRIEASGFALLDSNLEEASMVTANVEPNSVIEGISPIWADLDGDGEREIIVTVSNDQDGAGLVVYDESGDIVARGPVIGRGGRWRHQIAVAPFGPNGEIEIVDVLTPHIGGIVEFFQLQGDELVMSASLRGYTSHRIGSRNLDMAAAADFDGDGNVELLVADQNNTRLAAIRHTEDGAEEVWSIPLPARLATNISVVTKDSGDIEVAVGLEDGTILIWRATQ